MEVNEVFATSVSVWPSNTNSKLQPSDLQQPDFFLQNQPYLRSNVHDEDDVRYHAGECGSDKDRNRYRRRKHRAKSRLGSADVELNRVQRRNMLEVIYVVRHGVSSRPTSESYIPLPCVVSSLLLPYMSCCVPVERTTFSRHQSRSTAVLTLYPRSTAPTG